MAARPDDDALRALLAASRPTWQTAAACRDSLLDFTSVEDRPACLQTCGGCKVRLLCRDWADQIGDRHATLGGEDASARKARWRNQRRAS